jgi:phosphohistidine phosphatase SixA
MRVILLRHGHDLPSDQGEPALSKQGRAQIAETAQALKASGIDDIHAAVSSTALRARQSLAEFESHFAIAEKGFSVGLSPDAESAELDPALLAFPRHSTVTVLVVGHEPQLSNAVLRWASLPENDPADTHCRPWTLSRGEAMVCTVSTSSDALRIHACPVTSYGQERALPTPEHFTPIGLSASV